MPKIALSALETFLLVQKSHLYQKVVMSGVSNYQQATRGMPDVSSSGAERGLSIPAPPALPRCSGMARRHMEGSQLGAAPKPAPRQR